MALKKHENYLKKVQNAEKGFVSLKNGSKKSEIKVETSEIQKVNNGSRVMVVEDESITAIDINEKLKQVGYNVTGTAKTGAEAIKKARELKPDIILMDVELKGDLDGIDSANAIKELDIPIIFLTGYTDEKTLERAEDVSPYGYLMKPFEEDELHSTVEMALKKHEKDVLSVEKVENNAKRKSDELKIEKTGVFFVSSVIVSLFVYGIATHSMTWFEYLLFIPAVYNIIITFLSLKKQSPPIYDDYFNPFVSILVPAHNEEHTIEKCVHTMAELDYSLNGSRNYEVIVINDGSHDGTSEILRGLKEEFSFLKIVTRKPPRSGKGKGYVLNDGLEICNGDVIAVFDADAVVEPDFLQKIVPYLNEDGVDGVQARVRMYNHDENLLTSMQEVEFAIFGNVILKARDIMDKSAYLGGNGQLTLKSAIKGIDGWDGYAITEDLNMSIKLMIKGSKIRYCPEAVVYQEAVSEWHPFFRQRVRWATGNLETLFVYLNRIIDAPIPFYKKIDSIQYMFFLLLLAFVMFGYAVFILNIGNIYPFKLEAPIFIGILSTIAFFPGLLIGTYKDTKKIHLAVIKSVEYWAYCLYLMPLFFAAFLKMITRKERKWAKTKHNGQSKELS
jgi:1,2-diacylglycerol 3-beta-glucosyltransferase